MVSRDKHLGSCVTNSLNGSCCPALQVSNPSNGCYRGTWIWMIKHYVIHLARHIRLWSKLNIYRLNFTLTSHRTCNQLLNFILQTRTKLKSILQNIVWWMTHNLVTEVRFPRIGGIGPSRWFELKSLRQKHSVNVKCSMFQWNFIFQSKIICNLLRRWTWR